MKNEKYHKYKRVKNQISYRYKNHYPVEKILGIDLGILIFAKKKFTVKSYLSYIIKHTLPIFFKTLNLNDLKVNEPSKTLFTMGTFKRKDYYEIREDVKSRIKKTASFDFSTQNHTYKLSFKNIYLAWTIINRTKELGLLSRFRLASKMTFYLNVIDDLEKINPVFGKYCAFSSVHDYETLLTSYFQKKKIKTYSLQHGIYSVLHDNITLDMILYENFISDFHLCWGQYTKDEFAKYGIGKDALIVAGYPRKVSRPSIPSGLNKNECLLLLTSYMYHESNIKLLQIIKELISAHEPNLKVNIKIHPNSVREKYEEIAAEYQNWNIIPQEQTLTELFKSSKFGWAAAINSAAYYESYIYNIPCFRLTDPAFEDSVDINDDKFSNLNELKERLNVVPFEDSEKLKTYFQEINDRLNYAIGINRDEYQVLEV